MKAKKQSNHNGFTLMEMLIVVAIIAILVAIAIPMLSGVVAKASAAQCIANRTIIMRVFQTQLIDQSDIDTAPELRSLANKIIREAKKESSEYFSTKCVCQAGGTYSYKLGGIVCSNKYHGGTAGSGGVEETLEDDMSSALDEIYDDKAKLSQKEFTEKYGFGPHQITNDNLRSYLYNHVYEGTWPKFSDSFKSKNSISDDYYIQPFVDEGNKELESKDIIIFARTTNKLENNWYTNMYFSFEHDAWFKRKSSTSVNTFRTNSALEEDIKNHPELWTELLN